MNVLVNEIISKKISSENDFRNLQNLKYYYNSEQITQPMIDRMSEGQLSDQKDEAKIMIDYQIKEYWHRVEDLISRYND